MIIKGLNDTDFVNYRKPSMFIIFPKCSFKCGIKECQNSQIALDPCIEVTNKRLIDLYNSNPLTSAIVCGGLEPFDSWDDLFSFIDDFRLESDDDIVIYTGYTEEEIQDKIDILKDYDKLIIKYEEKLQKQTRNKIEV